ncbi:RidA family protein [Sphingobacterium oryzagri]|uniref:RidA family protein n=1 Tax=Sphingobacterium oryzagri TaxID=3025669 RepID=A0ABY7WKF7_9SPHI|nr:RidA family protein [Sphingobacterium sp. KACC 22765]WDF70072.1 RidA family protein [Sphingobacterium sp. KACC 22765]
MKKTISNPWTWQHARSYVQAVAVTDVSSTLYCAGQAAIHPDGTTSDGDMAMQLTLAIQNLEEVIQQADFSCAGIVRLNIYTTSSAEFMQHFDILQQWVEKHDIRQATSLIEVNGLFENLLVELEATVVK